MREQIQQISITGDAESQGNLLYLFVNNTEYEYSGDWQWDLHCDAVFCSDVMVALPAQFEGTRGIIYPDDKAYVLQQLQGSGAEAITFLQFRIITTYGEVKVLTGRNLHASVIQAFIRTEPQVLEQLQEAHDTSFKTQQLNWQKRAAELSERLTGTGTWYYDSASNDMYYSDEVFRIFDLPRQSLNAHLGTFAGFVHPDDRETVTDAFNRSLRERLPLHIDFRIITANNKEKLVHQSTSWEYGENGSQVLYGSIQDITDQNLQEQHIQATAYDLAFKDQLLQLHEQSSGMAHWYINLITRKVFYSDAMYKLHGIKPGSIAVTGNSFFNYVHPDDRDLVMEVHKRILMQHVPPDLDFRIVRNDGKVRQVRQQGKLVVYGEGELVMIVTLRDITTEMATAQKLSELKQQVTIGKFAQLQAEEMAAMGTFWWEVESNVYTWSDSLFRLLGQKSSGLELTQKHLLRVLHPEDRKLFGDEVKLTLQEKQERRFEFRIFRIGELRQICATFKLISYNGSDLFVGTLQDITEQHQLQHQLFIQAQQATSIAENMLDRAVITDTDNIIQVWNKRCEEAYGLKKEATLGKNIFDVLPHLKNDTDLALFRQVLQGEVIFHSHSKSNFRQEYHDLHMIPLYDEANKITGILHLLHDVTKEHEMQRRLSERLNFIESLLEASVDRIIVMDRYMNYLYCNTKAALFYGLRKEDIIGKNVLEVFPGSINDPTHEHFRKALRGETVHIPAIEGFEEEHYYEVFLIPILDESGGVPAVLWMHHDLSAEIRIQRQLRKSHEILNTIDAVFIELDHDFRFKYINDAAENILGNKRAELTGKLFWDVFPQELGLPGYDAIQNANTNRTKETTEYFSHLFRKWVYLAVAPSGDGVILFFNDRQDIHETQLRLQESEALLRESELAANTGSYEADLATSMFRFSDGLYRLFGEEPQSFQPTMAYIDSHSHPDDIPVVKAVLEQAALTKQPYHYTRRIYRKDGALRTLDSHGKVVCDETGQPVKFLGLVQDITERQRFSETIQQMLDGSIAAICLLDSVRNKTGKIVDFVFRAGNKAAERFNQKSTEEILGQRLLEVFPGVKDVFFDEYVQVVETGVPLRTERYYDHEHFKNWFDVSAIKNGDGVIVTFYDITSQKYAEQELLRVKDALTQQATDKYLNLFNSIDEAFGIVEVFFDAQGNPEDYRWIEANPQFEPVTGVPRTELLSGKTMRQSIPEIVNEEWIQVYGGVAQTGTPRRFEAYSKSFNRWFDVYAFRVGKPEDHQVAALFDDITERKRREANIAFYSEISDAFSRSLTPDAIMQHIGARIGDYMNITSVNFFDIDQTQKLSASFSWVKPGYIAVTGDQYHIKDCLADGLEPAALAGETWVVCDTQTDARIKAEICSKLKMGSFVGIPFHNEGAWKYFLLVTDAQPRTWRDDEIEFFKELANRIFPRLERARAEDQLRNVTTMLEEQVAERTYDLRESKELIEKIAHTTPDLITIHDVVTDRIIYANHGNLWEGKLSEEELLNAPNEKRIQLLIHPDDQQKASDFSKSRRMLADDEMLEIVLRNQFGNKEWGWVKVRSKVFKRDAEGQATEIISFTSNITKQRYHEEELFKNLNLLQQAEDMAGMGSWEYRIAEDAMTWSEGMYQLFDLPAGKKVKKETYLEFALKEELPVVKRFLKQLRLGAASIDETVTIVTKEGVRKILRVKGIAVNDTDGKPVQVLGVDLDITDLVRTDEALRALNRSLDQRNRELEAKNEELANFSFIASHDLREPLRKIHTFSDWLLLREKERLSEIGQQYLKRMALSVERMDQLIEDVLVLTKMQASVFEPDAVDLNEVLAAVKAEGAESIKHLKATIKADPLPVVPGNKMQLKHLFKNLISNALKFQKPGNQPVLRIESAEATADEIVSLNLNIDHAYSRISFIDNGIGIDKKFIHKIFQIFQRLHSRTDYEGTGIGLTICKKVMENHQGTITLESTPGKGSRFNCYFPVG